jgi:hypothetical protein
VWHSGSKERLGDIFVLFKAADNIQSPSFTEICSHFLRAAQKNGYLV